MGRKEAGPYNPGKKLPGEAHKQPQLATQYYLRAKDEECLRIRNVVKANFLLKIVAHLPKSAKFVPNFAKLVKVSLDFGQNSPEFSRHLPNFAI